MISYSCCRLCPRCCGVDRRGGQRGGQRGGERGGQRGFCKESDTPRLALATLHHGEEPALSGSEGSGTLFFTGCTLKCSFCQNCDLSRAAVGREVSLEELEQIFLEIQLRGAENLNIVTGTHFLPTIAEALRLARTHGLSLPVLWNSSGYENDTGLGLIESFTDVFLPDLKTLDSQLAEELFKASDYPMAATGAIRNMAAFGGPVFDQNGMLIRGTLVRHLVLPGLLENTRRVLEWFAENLAGKALLSVMFQYLPLKGEITKAPARTIEDSEYYAVIGMLEELDLDDGYIQEPAADSPWLPDFEKDNPFPDEYSKVVWHWKGGFARTGSPP